MHLARWLTNQSAPVALATVVQTWGSSPRQVGAKMAFTADNQIFGSVSGGCVEGAVISAGEMVLQTGQPQLLHFGVADETAWEVGLACGGEIWVWVERLETAVANFLTHLHTHDQAGAIVTIIRGPDHLRGQKLLLNNATEPPSPLPPDLARTIRDLLPTLAQSQRYQLNEEIELFVDWQRPLPTLIIIGGGHIAIPLTMLAQTVGFRVIVIDPRRAFANPDRFPHADQLLARWPEKALAEMTISEATAVALLSHDPKIDDPALHIALRSPAFYIGALGSQKTHAARTQRLRHNGFNDDQIGRIHAPIGLNINAQTPEEIALAILAEIVNVQRTAK